jgi:hypothetical protein
MSAKAIRELESELGAAAPAGLRSLTEAQLHGLADLLREAKRRQSGALESAVEAALEIVPRMVRGPVRKILFG